MSIRLRLALWYGALLAIVLLSVELLIYMFHVRGQYEDFDRLLVASANHARVEAETMPAGYHPLASSGGLDLALRLYDAQGALLESSSAVQTLPKADPASILAAPSGPAYDWVAGLAPPILILPPEAGDGAFGLIAAAGERWRVYVVPLRRSGSLRGYIETLTPLGSLDAAIQRFRLIQLSLGLTGLLVCVLANWALASGALRPIARMIHTAQAIAAARDFAGRVQSSSQRDELARLAETFNSMLASLEEAYRAQQRFVSDASHELRAPLTAIQGNLELIRRHPEMPRDGQEEALAEVEREAARLARLVSDLLALARADAGVAFKREITELDELVLEVFREGRQLARGQTLILEPFEPARVRGDADRLKQLLLILLDNALKYTPPEGRVTLGLKKAERQAMVVVSNTGPGISPDDLPHVFERFYRADPARSHDPGGTGLGLPIARWIAEQHGGQIELQSTPDAGTTATVRLPLLQ